MSDHAALEKGLRAYLKTTTAGTLVSNRIVIDFAPEGTAYPHLLLNLNAERGPDAQKRRTGDYRYTIKAVVRNDGTTDALALAHQISSALYEALNEQHASINLDSPWVVFRVERIAVISFTDQKDRVQYHHRGGVYRIQVSEEFS